MKISPTAPAALALALALAGTVVVTALAGTAHADDTLAPAVPPSAIAAPPAPAVPAVPPPGKVTVQAQFEILPSGTVEAFIGEESESLDAELAYGVSAAIDIPLTRHLRVGVAPRVVFNVITEEHDRDDEAATEFDLRLRMVAHGPMAPGVEGYVLFSPGYGILVPAESEEESLTGFSLAAAVGITLDVSSSMFLSAEAGYQRTYLTTDAMVAGVSFDLDIDVSYFHLGLGAGTRF